MIWDFLTYVVILAILYTLVRPNSPAETAITDISKAMIAVVGTATGYI